VTYNLLDKPFDCGALEAKLQRLAARKETVIRIKVDIIVANISDVDESDFCKYKSDGLGKPLSLSSVDVYVDSG
jgi:hypothetical protein